MQVLGAKRSTRPKSGEKTLPAFLYFFAVPLVACSAWLLASPAYTDSAKRNRTRLDPPDHCGNTTESQGERMDTQTAANAALKLPTALNSAFSLDAAHSTVQSQTPGQVSQHRKASPDLLVFLQSRP